MCDNHSWLEFEYPYGMARAEWSKSPDKVLCLIKGYQLFYKQCQYCYYNINGNISNSSLPFNQFVNNFTLYVLPPAGYLLPCCIIWCSVDSSDDTDDNHLCYSYCRLLLCRQKVPCRFFCNQGLKNLFYIQRLNPQSQILVLSQVI